MTVTTFAPHPVPAHAKWAFTTRRVTRADLHGLQANVSLATPGDLVLGQILRLGQHKKIQLATGRYSEAYLGDFVVLACGDRYAPDQFEGVAALDPDGADLIAGGGLLGQMRQSHDQMSSPTRIRPLGLLTDAGGAVVNLERYALGHRPPSNDVTVILVVGASMNAGKTTAAVSLAHGLSRAGLRVAGIKATGTGAFGDFNAFQDAGIAMVADFTDAGMASTYRQPLERIERGFETLIAHAAAEGAEVAVVELADGIFQKETAELLRSPRIRNAVAGVMYATPDAIGAAGGVSLLRQLGLEPFAVSGKVTCSPLASAEAEAATRVPLVSRAGLCDPVRALELTGGMVPGGLLRQKQAA